MIPEEVARRERLNALRHADINPYPAESKRTHMIADVLLHFSELEKTDEKLVVCGRVRSLRKHGGLTFLTIEDESGKMQVAIKRDVVGTENYLFFHNHIDIGDFLEINGSVFVTQRGEQSLNTERWTLLAKTILPLPEKWHGLTDTEKRYRYRYLDLLSNPLVVNRARIRSQIVRSMRSFLESEGFLEVETPILQPIAGGASARPFVTHHNTLHHDFYLRIAPELYLKRLIVGGFEKIYEFARCFRNEGISPQHNPEFTQIELYWAYATIEDLMEHLERMLQKIVEEVLPNNSVELDNKTITFNFPIPRFSFHDLIETETGIDLNQIKDEEALRKTMKDKNIDVEDIVGYAELVDHLWKLEARPKVIQPTFVIDYPASMKPLAKRREDDHYSASAQLVIDGMEVWNAFNEQNDPIEQEEIFEEQESLRERGSEDAQQIDHDFLKALKHGMPPTAGYGIGIDRLVAILTGANNLKEVILFPTLKPIPYEEDSDDVRDV
ncbi:MAG: lysine--tRNA ligase [Patescibacteria group bacterium]